MKKRYLKVIIFTIMVLLCIFGIKSKVFAEEKDIKDFNYISDKEVFVGNDCGDFKIDNNGNKYFHYSHFDFVKESDTIEIIYKDGTKDTYTYYYRDTNGNYVFKSSDVYKGYEYLKIKDEQTKEHWKVNSTTYLTIELLGIQKKIPVTIKETPVKEIEYTPVERLATNVITSELHQGWVGGRDGDKLQIIYKDGTKKIYTYRDEPLISNFYDDKGNRIEYDFNIVNIPNQWRVGKNNYMTISYLGVEDTAKVEFIEDCHSFGYISRKKSKCNFCGITIELSKEKLKFNNKVQLPTVIVKDSNGKKISKSKYSLCCPSGKSKNVGSYYLTVDFENNGSGDTAGEFIYEIIPKGVKIKKIVANKKGFTVKWSKNITQTTGYQIQYSTNSKFKSGNKTITIKNNKTTSKKVKNLKKNKKYYVRIRTYKTVKGVKYYSGWSKILKVKTK